MNTRIRRFQLIALTVAVGLFAGSAWAIQGVEVSALNGDSVSPGTTIYTNPSGIYQQGGENVSFSTLTYNDGRGLAKAEAELVNNGIVPTVKAITQPAAGGVVGNYAGAFAGAIQAYQYNGASPALITFNYELTADLSETAGLTAAFLRARAALVTDMSYFSTTIGDSGIVQDDYDLQLSNDEIGADYTGSIAFTANPGQIFNLVLSLQTAASVAPAYVDAFSTFTGTLGSSTGSITVVPEPATATMLALFAAGGLLIRRRNTRA